MGIEKYFTNILRDIRKLDRRLSRIESQGVRNPMFVGKKRSVTLSSGSFVGVFDFYSVEPESGVTDELDEIIFRDPNVPIAGKKIMLAPASGCTITVKDGTGNIDLTGAGGDVVLDHSAKSVVLMFDMDYGKWIAYSVNAG